MDNNYWSRRFLFGKIESENDFQCAMNAIIATNEAYTDHFRGLNSSLYRNLHKEDNENDEIQAKNQAKSR